MTPDVVISGYPEGRNGYRRKRHLRKMNEELTRIPKKFQRI